MTKSQNEQSNNKRQETRMWFALSPKTLALLLLFLALVRTSDGRNNLVRKTTDQLDDVMDMKETHVLVHRDDPLPERVEEQTTVGAVTDCTLEDQDCLGVCFGTAVVDQCGTCNGNNEACTDCHGEINGPHVLDRSRQCCRREDIDCNGDCMGMAQKDGSGLCCYANQKDDCGKCFGSNTCLDCNADPHGKALRDSCGICSGGNSQHVRDSDKDCSGACFGPARPDDCNVCSGGDTGRNPNSDKDCRGVCFGPTKTDVCGDCGGDGSCQTLP